MTTQPPIQGAHIRIARPTDNISGLKNFYINGLGFSVLYTFTDHNGFDGLMLGFEGMGYHLEFTQKNRHHAGKAPTEDNLLVFYIDEEDRWREAVERMRRVGFESVKAFNPYWDAKGKTFEDADGYRVVLQCAGWVNKKAEE